MSSLDRKLIRDMLHMKGQVIAICAVIGCGVGTFIMSLTALAALQTTQAKYYDDYRFARIFSGLKRAPLTVVPRIERISGVSQVQPRIVRDVTLDVPTLKEPAIGRLISIPERRQSGLNELHLRQGRYIEPERSDEVLVSEGFANAHKYKPGDKVTAILNGRKKQLLIVGVALSPEYVYQLRPGALVPDDKRFGIFWMGRTALSAAFDIEGAFNDICLDLMPGVPEEEVIARVDELLEPYGGLGAYGRYDQISNRFLSDEIKQLRRMGLIVPSIFLIVAAFLLNVVLSRIVALQRDQIAALKAFGYTDVAVGWHYLKFVLAVAVAGVIGGTGVGCYLGQQITEIYGKFYRFPTLQFVLPWPVIGWSFVISGIAAMSGTLGVVYRAMKLPPAEAMRPEAPPMYRPTILERLGFNAWLMQPSRMILRHLERRPLKASFSILGISLAVAILILGRFSTDALDHLLGVHFELVERQDITVSFIEPRNVATMHEIEHLPGVLFVEPFRSVPIKLEFEHRSRRTAIRGLPPVLELSRLLDESQQPIPLPPDGLVLNSKLAQLMGAKLGDVVTVHVLEGERPVRRVPITGISTEMLGTAAYMDMRALNRVMREGDNISGVVLLSDSKRVDELYRKLKDMPQVASVSIKDAAVRSFRDTVIENMLQMQFFNFVFACIIAFGVVYNTARIALSERGRELASLRVLGLTRGEISYILLGELTLLTIVAIPIGLVEGYILVRITTYFLDTELYRVPAIVNPFTYGFSIMVVIVSAIISGLFVRRRLDTLDLIAVLKTRE